jgi:hypothetical protein
MWFLFIVLSAFAAPGEGYLCHDNNSCGSRGLLTERQAGPAKSDSIKVNPAAVPVEKVTGVETLFYKGAFDVGLVKGLGRVGAALSPSNSDETFFGAPAAEAPGALTERMESRSKYDSGKYTGAVAISLLSRNGSGLRNLHLQMGLLGRYESFSKHVKPGVGVLGIAGPLYAGASYLQDEIRIASAPDVWLTTALGTYSFGLSLNSILLDYSVLDVSGDFHARASVATVAVFVGRFILTGARRETRSGEKFFYDFDSRSLSSATSQVDLFAGVQFKTTSFLILGAFYNYYLLREVSFGATLFF